MLSWASLTRVGLLAQQRLSLRSSEDLHEVLFAKDAVVAAVRNDGHALQHASEAEIGSLYGSRAVLVV